MSDWRSRAKPINQIDGMAIKPMTEEDVYNALVAGNPKLADTGAVQSDWRSRAKPVTVAQNQQPAMTDAKQTNGVAGGRGRAFGQAITGGQIPFGNVITSGLAAGALAPFTDLTFRELYDQAQADTKATQKAYPGTTLAGNVLGAVSTLPMVSSKALFGTEAATQGARGAINAIPAGLSKAGDFVRGSKVAKDAGALAKAGNLGLQAVKSAAVAAPTAGLYAAGESDAGKRLEGFKSGAGMGAAVGAALPVAGAALGAAGGAAINALGQRTPDISEAGTKVYNMAKKFNIPVAIDDLTDDAAYKTMISEGRTLPGSAKFADFGERQHKRWVNEVAKTFGEDTDKITPEIVDKAFTRLGGEFDSFFNGKIINLGEDFGLGLRQKDFIDEVGDLYSTPGKDTITKLITQINSAIRPDGTINGNVLGAIRNRASKIARSGNPEIAGAARDVEQFIIDSVADVSEEGAAQAFKNTKYQYKNLIAVEPLAQKAQVSGLISPAQLLGRVRQVYGRSFSRGNAGDIGELANLGQYIKETIPNSGTSQRSSIRKLLTGEAVSSIPLSVGAGLVSGNPLASVGVTAAAVGAKGLGAAINRSVQTKNVNPAVIEKMIKQGKKITPQQFNALQKTGRLSAVENAAKGSAIMSSTGQKDKQAFNEARRKK